MASTVLLCEMANTSGNVSSGNETASHQYTSAATSGLPTDGSNLFVSVCGSDYPDYCGWYATGFPAGRTGIVVADPTDPAQTPGKFTPGRYISRTGRHLDGSNYLLADGHVKWYKGDSVSVGKVAATSTSAEDPILGNHTTAEGTQYSGSGQHAVTFSPR